jgi:hypothetical protein
MGVTFGPDGGRTGYPTGATRGPDEVPDGGQTGPDEGQTGCPTGASWGLDGVADGRIIYF